jgi:ATP-dependent Clp protease ATP-binding subunit ClpX
MATVEDLDMDSLVRILSEPKNALTRQYARMFEMDDVELVFTSDSLDAIAAQAIKRGTGARGLRAILEEVLLNTMYDLPSRTDIERVVIDRDVVAEKVNPTLVPAREDPGPAEKSA